MNRRTPPSTRFVTGLYCNHVTVVSSPSVSDVNDKIKFMYKMYKMKMNELKPNLGRVEMKVNLVYPRDRTAFTQWKCCLNAFRSAVSSFIGSLTDVCFFNFTWG